MKQVLQFFTSSMASAPIKVQDVLAVSSTSRSNKSHQFPLATIEEARDEDELENSLVRAQEDAREEACEPVNTTPRQKQHKQDIVKPSKDESSALTSSTATPPMLTAEETNDGFKGHKGLCFKQKVLSLRKGRSLLRRKNSNSQTLTDGSSTPTPNDEIKSNHYGKQRRLKRSQSYIPIEIAFNPNDNDDDDDGLTIPDTIANNTSSSVCMFLESVRNFDLADLGDYAISEYEYCG